MSVNQTRLEVDLLPEAARANCDINSPPPLRMMGAKAMLPLAPAELVTVLYQLKFDPEPKIREAAVQSANDLPDDILGAAAAARLDPRVLDFLGHIIMGSDALLQPFVLNQAVDDVTMAFVARHASEKITEIVAGIHIRLLRAPAIIESLYGNPNTRMSTVDKLLDLARREGVELAGYPGLQEAIHNAEYDDGNKGISDDEFKQIIQGSVRDEKEGREVVDDAKMASLLSGDEPATEEEQSRKSRWQLIQDMNPSQKIRLSMVGTREDRNLLLRDTKKVVHMAAIKSPKISPAEVQRLASNRSLPDSVIGYIATNGDWTRRYPVVLNLANNPKCPIRHSMRFVNQLHVADLKAIQRNKNIPSQLARHAKNVYRQKSGGGRK